MKQMVLVAALLLSAGCMSSQELSDEYVPRYQDKPVDLVVDRWGVPSRTIKADGGTIYVWENAAPARNCRIEAHVNERGNVIGIRGRGQEQACIVWMRMLAYGAAAPPRKSPVV